MTPDEIRDLRGSRSQSAMASLCSVALRTWQDWESGQRNPKGTALLILQLAAEHPGILDWLKLKAEQRGVEFKTTTTDVKQRTPR